MDGDPLGPQQPVCVFCWPYRNEDGSVIRDCDACVGRDVDRWCECTFCPWLTEGD